MRRFIQDKGRNDKPQVWEITVVKGSVHSMWGQLNGAMQETTEDCKPVNVGKKNEKNAAEVAKETAERLILKKTRQGYVEVNLKTNKPLGKASASTIDFTKLPTNLRFFKPQNSMNAYCTKLEDAAYYLRKRDGMMHVVAVDDDQYPRLYGSNMLINHKDEPGIPWMDRYPQLQAELERMNLPPKTILLGEIVTCVATNPEKYSDTLSFAIDDFIYVGSIIKSKTELALEKQEGYGPLGFCIWDIAFWGGECLLQEMPAKKRFTMLRNILSERKNKLVSMPEVVTVLPDGSGFMVQSVEGEYREDQFEFDDVEDIQGDLAGWARNMGWEGYVVVDPDSTYGDRAYNFHGKAERPKFVCKLKPELEADFVMLWDPDNGIGEWGKGKKKGGVGAAMAHLVDPKTGELVEICKVGGGLTDKLVKEFANPKLFPMVWQCGFSEWTDKGALRFPKFLRKRDDKKPEECTVDQNPAWKGE